MIGTKDPTANQIVDITYVAGRKTEAGKAASFNGTTSIIEISNGDQLMNTNNFTLSFWVKAIPHTDNADKGHFVMGLGAFFGFQFEIYGGFGGWKLATRYNYNNAGTIGTTTEDNGFNGDGKGASNGGWQGFAFTKDLTTSGGPASIIKDKWAHIVYTYNGATKQGIYYANGEKMREMDFDLWPDGDNKRFITGLKYGAQSLMLKTNLLLDSYNRGLEHFGTMNLGVGMTCRDLITSKVYWMMYSFIIKCLLLEKLPPCIIQVNHNIFRLIMCRGFQAAETPYFKKLL